MKHIEVSVIIVSYNSKEVLKNCLQSLFNSQPQVNFEVIVVDNHGNDGVAEMVSMVFPRVKLVKASGNKGYAAGNNLGFTHANGNFIFLLNPDTIVVDDALSALVDFMLRHPRAGIVGCTLISPGHRKLASFARSTLGPLETACEDVNTRGWVSGAAMMVRRETLEQGF